MNFQLMHMSDGWYAQYFLPFNSVPLRPNQDLLNYLYLTGHFDRLKFVLDMKYYQKFSGSKVLQDEVSIPNLNVLPRIKLIYQFSPIEWLSMVENLSSNKDKDQYSSVFRGLNYFGYNGRQGDFFMYKLGGWFKFQNIYDCLSCKRRQHSFVVPNIELSFSHRYLEKTNLSLSYAYTAYVDQKNDAIFQRRWRWIQGQWDFDKLISVDRIYDRNRMWIDFYQKGVFQMSSLFVGVSHIFDFSRPRVSLSETGVEDPLIQYANQVSIFRVGDLNRNLDFNGVWIWPLSKFFQYQLEWKYHGLLVKLMRQPDIVTVQNHLVSVPMYKSTNISFDVFQRQNTKFFLGVNYVNGLDKSLAYKSGAVIDQCCWKARFSLDLIKWMSQDDFSQPVFQGLQPSFKMGFSLKGMQVAKKNIS